MSYLDAMLGSEYVLPCQVHGTVSAKSGELALMYAVLQDAVDYLMKAQARAYTSVAIARRYANYYRDAYRWVESNDEDYLYSFVNCCRCLGLSPSALRRRLLRGLMPTALGPFAADVLPVAWRDPPILGRDIILGERGRAYLCTVRTPLGVYVLTVENYQRDAAVQEATAVYAAIRNGNGHA